MTPTFVYVVDDHPIVLQGIQLVLEGLDDILLIGSADRAARALSEILELMPQVLLLDVRLGHEDSLSLLREVSTRLPQLAVLLFTADTSHPAVPEALELGAVGVISKGVSPATLREAMIAAGKGLRIPSSEAVATAAELPPLTPRELEVLRHVAIGRTNPEIGVELGLTTSTVKTYWQSTMQKLGVRNRAEAVSSAYKLRLFDDLGTPSPFGGASTAEAAL